MTLPAIVANAFRPPPELQGGLLVVGMVVLFFAILHFIP